MSRLHRRTQLGLERLEAREVPATVVNATTLTYQDFDGDNVTVKFSKAILTAANANSIFTFSSGAMAVNGSNVAKEALWKINLAGVGGMAGTSVTTSAIQSLTHGGDGFANLGELTATNLDLAAVVVDGDLGRVIAGDSDAVTTGLPGLTAQSLGRFGTTTGAMNLASSVNGKVGSLTIKGDVKEASFKVTGGAFGDLGPVLVGGSLLGGGSLLSGLISAEGDIASVIIKGDMIGTSLGSGSVTAGQSMGAVTVNGSIKATGINSGRIFAESSLGFVKVVGDVSG